MYVYFLTDIVRKMSYERKVSNKAQNGINKLCMNSQIINYGIAVLEYNCSELLLLIKI